MFIRFTVPSSDRTVIKALTAALAGAFPTHRTSEYLLHTSKKHRYISQRSVGPYKSMLLSFLQRHDPIV